MQKLNIVRLLPAALIAVSILLLLSLLSSTTHLSLFLKSEQESKGSVRRSHQHQHHDDDDHREDRAAIDKVDDTDQNAKYLKKLERDNLHDDFPTPTGTNRKMDKNDDDDDDHAKHSVSSSTQQQQQKLLLIDPLPPAKSFLPVVAATSDNDDRGASRVERTVQNGMQPKYLVRNVIWKGNTIYWRKKSGGGGGGDQQQHLPSKIYLPDGQVGPMKQNHRYTGHAVKAFPNSVHDDDGGGGGAGSSKCACRVTRPTIFLYRMSGHSTYHLWENNLGPFFQTLFDFQKDFSSSSTESSNDLLDPTKLLIVFTDSKPRHGPKSPHLLDQLLRTFTNLPLINASRIGDSDLCRSRNKNYNGKNGFVCFDRAILGISSNSYRMRPLVEMMKRNILGDNIHAQRVSTMITTRNSNKDDDEKAPEHQQIQPRVAYISRNHPGVIRGRKIRNELSMLTALNDTLVFNGVEAGVTKIFMEEMSYADQVRFSSSVDIMFSPHGGGVANCIWMKPGSVMVEFVAPVGKTLPNMYHSMCTRSGIQHFHFLAEPDPDDAARDDAVFLSNKRLFSNMKVPEDLIKRMALKALELWRGGGGGGRGGKKVRRVEGVRVVRNKDEIRA